MMTFAVRRGGWVSRLVSTTSLLQLVAAAAATVLLYPIAWMVSTSVKPREEVFRYPPQWIPDHWSLAAYASALSGPIARFLLNSIIVAAGTALLATVAGALAAYAVSRRGSTAGRAILLIMLATLAFPLPLLMISIYQVFAAAGLLDTYLAVILGHTILVLPVAVWLLKGFFDSLPIEVEESAYVDGASAIQILRHIVLPMARPGLTAAAIYCFVTSWNEFIIGLTFTSSTAMRPLPTGINLLFLQELQYQWPEMMAVATLATIPILVLFAVFQRNFVEGVTAGAVKL
jgi:multiple sugar transport system permease protein